MDQREDTVGTYSWEDHDSRLYDDRFDAGARLAEHLLAYRGHSPLVLAIPRGGVPVACPIADRLGAELDVIVARKLGAPHQNELAIGAVTADGARVLNRSLIDRLHVPAAYLDRVTAVERAEAQRRERAFRAGLPALAAAGRVVLLVDDGLATGATMRACVHALREAGAEKVAVAVPVGSTEACAELAPQVDALVCPWQPDPFFAVGAHYRHFEQVSDEEVERVLAEHRAQRSARPAARHAAR